MTRPESRKSAKAAWIEVRVVAPVGLHEIVADALASDPCTSVAFGRTSVGMEPPPDGYDYVRTFYPAEFDGDEVRDALRARLAACARATELPELEGLAVRFHELPPEDFATSWKKTWRPFRVGRISVVPPDYERPGHNGHDGRPERPARDGELYLILEPGGVFGTGRHATTRAVLRFLQTLVEPGDRVVDAGAGTGILSVAAALLGAEEVFGFDIDANSRQAAELCAERSGVLPRCRFETGGFERLAHFAPAARGAADGLLANIYADVLQAHASDMAAALAPGAWCVFSGCLDEHADETRPALAAAGFVLDAEVKRGRWHTFAGHKEH